MPRVDICHARGGVIAVERDRHVADVMTRRLEYLLQTRAMRERSPLDREAGHGWSVVDERVVGEQRRHRFGLVAVEVPCVGSEQIGDRLTVVALIARFHSRSSSHEAECSSRRQYLTG